MKAWPSTISCVTGSGATIGMTEPMGLALSRSTSIVDANIRAKTCVATGEAQLVLGASCSQPVKTGPRCRAVIVTEARAWAGSAPRAVTVAWTVGSLSALAVTL